MITCKDSFVFFTCVVLFACNGLTGQDLQFSLSRNSIIPGERTTLEIRLPLEWLRSEGWREGEELPSINDDFLSLSSSILVLSSDYRRENTALVWIYEITAHKTGIVHVPPVEIHVGPRSFSTEKADLTVITTRKDDDFELRKEFGPLTPLSHKPRWFFLLLILPLAYGLYRLLKRYLPHILAHFPKPRARRELPYPGLTHLEWLKSQFNRIKSTLSESTFQNSLVDDLTFILREYYARRFAKPVKSWTSKEFQQHFSAHPEARELCKVFEQCDEIKFTGKKIPNPAGLVAGWIAESERILIPCGT